MPSHHRFPNTSFRVDPQLRNRALIAVGEVGSDMNSYLVTCLRWLVGDIDELPARPPERVPDDPGPL